MFDFPPTVAAIDEVPEEFRACYEQGEDGSAALIETLAKRGSDTANLRKALEAERKANRQKDADLRAYSSLGRKPDELKTLIEGFTSIAETPEALRELMDSHAKNAPDVAKAVAQVKEQAEKESKKVADALRAQIEERDKRLSSTRTVLEREMVGTALTQEIVRQKGSHRMLLPLLSRFVKVVEVDGQIERQVVDDAGDPRINVRGEPMSIAELVSEIKADPEFANAFEGDGRGGSGSQSNNGNGGGSSTRVKTYSKEEWLAVTSKAKGEERQKLLRDAAAGRIIVK